MPGERGRRVVSEPGVPKETGDARHEGRSPKLASWFGGRRVASLGLTGGTAFADSCADVSRPGSPWVHRADGLHVGTDPGRMGVDHPGHSRFGVLERFGQNSNYTDGKTVSL